MKNNAKSHWLPFFDTQTKKKVLLKPFEECRNDQEGERERVMLFKEYDWLSYRRWEEENKYRENEMPARLGPTWFLSEFFLIKYFGIHFSLGLCDFKLKQWSQ